MKQEADKTQTPVPTTDAPDAPDKAPAPRRQQRPALRVKTGLRAGERPRRMSSQSPNDPEGLINSI
jgi:hypothetical protein